MDAIIHYTKTFNERGLGIVLVYPIGPESGESICTYEIPRGHGVDIKVMLRFVVDSLPQFADIPYNKIKIKEMYQN